MEKQISESQARAEAENLTQNAALVLASLGEGVYGIDRNGCCTFINRAALYMLGFEKTEVIGAEPHVLFHHHHPDGSLYPHAECAIYQTLKDGIRRESEDAFIRADGEFLPVHLTATPIRQGNDTIGAVVVFRDITKQKADAKHIRHLNQIYAALAQTNQAIVRCRDEIALFAEVCRIAVEFGGMKMSWIGRPDEKSSIVKAVARYGSGTEYLDCIAVSTDVRVPEGRGPTGTAFRENRPVIVQDFLDDDSTSPWYECSSLYGWKASAAFPITRAGRPYAVLSVYHADKDAFEQKMVDLLSEMTTNISYALNMFDMAAEREAALAQQREAEHRLAYFDLLTGLPNRTLFSERASQIIHTAQNLDEPLALMFLDLDHFKNINDTLGHHIGDKLLIKVARRLQSSLREQDTVSRLGSDEFILLLPGANTATAANIAGKLLQGIALPYDIERHKLSITPSLGIAMYPTDGKDLETLYKCADMALRHAKQNGRNSYRFFTPEMQQRSARRLQLDNALRLALERKEFVLYYQPQVSVERGRIIGVEALLRWQHPELGMVPPSEFIPLAEESSLILPIGEWVLRTAVHQLKAWLQAGLPPMTVAVNLSAVQLRQHNFSQLVMQILDDAKLPAEYLELELTESAAMKDPETAIAIIGSLHQFGIRMAIDDFGTGYSSLAHLRRFKCNKLKIDQSFVRHINTSPADEAIVGAIISLAKSLRLRTIAEGVENERQLQFLRERGCEEVQGYYFSPPLPANALQEWLLFNNSS